MNIHRLEVGDIKVEFFPRMARPMSPEQIRELLKADDMPSDDKMLYYSSGYDPENEEKPEAN